MEATSNLSIGEKQIQFSTDLEGYKKLLNVLFAVKDECLDQRKAVTHSDGDTCQFKRHLYASVLTLPDLWTQTAEYLMELKSCPHSFPQVLWKVTHSFSSIRCHWLLCTSFFMNFCTLWQKSAAALNLAVFRARSCLPSPMVSWLDHPLHHPHPTLSTHRGSAASWQAWKELFPGRAATWRHVSLIIPLVWLGWDFHLASFRILNFPFRSWIFKAQSCSRSSL